MSGYESVLYNSVQFGLVFTDLPCRSAPKPCVDIYQQHIGFINSNLFNTQVEPLYKIKLSGLILLCWCANVMRAKEINCANIWWVLWPAEWPLCNKVQIKYTYITSWNSGWPVNPVDDLYCWYSCSLIHAVDGPYGTNEHTWSLSSSSWTC